jgi:hypothetical protein
MRQGVGDRGECAPAAVAAVDEIKLIGMKNGVSDTEVLAQAWLDSGPCRFE